VFADVGVVSGTALGSVLGVGVDVQMVGVGVAVRLVGEGVWLGCVSVGVLLV
jgi:hypothetical protein